MKAGRALIKVGYACNNSCVFCHSEGSTPPKDDAASVEAKIDAAASMGSSIVVFSGGEPTLRRELPGWARRAQGLGLPVGLVTNGRMLSYVRLMEELHGAGLAYAQVSLHSGYEAVHDRITRAAGSFQQTFLAVHGLHVLKVDLTVNMVVTRANIETLSELAEILEPLPGTRLKYSLVEPKGAALERFDELVPPPEEVAARVGEALAHAARQAPGLRLAHEGIPLCLLPGHEALASGLTQDGFTHMSEAHEEDFFPVDNDNREHPEICGGCALMPRCPGLYKTYIQRRAIPDLRPARETR
jgi:molybdenum cofactor biosynthesis enzyme MoaA